MTMMKKTILILTVIVLAKCANAQVSGQDMPAPKTFTVKVSGKGQPMILIPGYTCSGDVWNETVKKFSGKFECHVLTLAGFAGVPADTGQQSLGKVKNEIIAYVKEKKLKGPVLLGHSLGGMLSLWMSSSEPALFSKVIIVDALPYYPMAFNPSATVETSKPYADRMKTTILNTVPTEAAARQNMEVMITDSANINKAVKWYLASDKSTMAQYIYDMMTIDLRSDLSKIKAPVLVLCSWSASKAYGGSKEETQKDYTSYYKDVANCKVEVADKARHFIMFDEPEWFLNEVDAFIK
jgi:N-formylmaleamate deformylase